MAYQTNDRRAIRKKRTGSHILLRRRGAVSLFLCMVIGMVTSIMLICLQGAALRKDEADLVRAGIAAAQTTLSSYDLDLLKDYGLWGVEKRNLSDQAFRNMLNDRTAAACAQMSVHTYTFDEDILSEQISAYMKVRAPAAWLDKLANALAAVKAPDLNAANECPGVPVSGGSGLRGNNYIGEGYEVFTAPLEPRLESISDIDMDDIMDFQMKLQEYMFKYIPYNLTMSAISSCLGWIFSPITEPLKNAASEHASKLIEQMISERLPVCPEDFTDESSITSGSLPEFFNPDDLAEMAGLADMLLCPPVCADKLHISEYCLAVFPSQVTSVIDRQTGDVKRMKTPDGRSHDTLEYRYSENVEDTDKSLRRNELEMIITGTNSPDQAALRVKGNLMMVRSIIRIIETISDQEKMNSFRPAANILSALITTASAGSVNIDPQTAVWLIAISESVKSAAEDTNSLIEGKTIPLWTYNQQSLVYFNYYDYMRLFLLIKPAEKTLSEIARVIKTALPGDYASSVKVDISYKKSTFSQVLSYRVNNQNSRMTYDEN